MEDLAPVIVLDLLPQERVSLLELLSSLAKDEWDTPTACIGWSVKDVALHLLGDDIGRLRSRDESDQDMSKEDRSWSELVAHVNSQNQLWVEAARRISGPLLCEFLALTGNVTLKYFNSLDLYALGRPVGWAGPDPAPVWLDIAREYTERWVHQQHIRAALDRPGLTDSVFVFPVLDTFVRALPHTFRDVDAPVRTLLKLIISGDGGGAWFLLREEDRWKICANVTKEPRSVVTIDQDTAWRLFTKGISKYIGLEKARFEGDKALGVKVLDTISVIA